MTVTEANRLHRYATTQAEMAACAGRNAVMAGLRLGKLLARLKEETNHGEWGNLFIKELSPNRTHASDLEFSQRTANRYIRCYKLALARLGTQERPSLELGLDDGQPTLLLTELVAKATDGAETPRQMQLNLGVISSRKKSRHEATPRHIGFTGSGNPAGAPATDPMDKLAADLARLNLTPEQLEKHRKQAEQDAASLLQQLGTYVDGGYASLLRPQERDMLVTSLRMHADNILKIINPCQINN